MLRYSIAIVAGIAIPALCIAQPAAPGDLVLNARAILHKHCSSCHNGGPGGKGELSVLSREGLNRPTRPFVQIQQMIDLIEDGSMPPGNRPAVPAADRQVLREWLAAGAGAYVQKYDEEYVLNTQLIDVRTRPAADLPFTRYVSLAHEVPDMATPLEPRRIAVRKALNELGKADGKLESVDPAETIFRFDVRRFGWDAKPFESVKEVNEKEVRTPLPWTLYDTVLLDYPHGQYYDDIKSFENLREAFLKPAAQVRPVAFLRGDWLADSLPKLAIAAELRKHFGKPDQPTARPNPADAAGSRTPILPFDSLAQDVEPKPEPFKVTYFETNDAKTKQGESKFKIGDTFFIAIHSNQDLYVEIVMTDAKGEKDVLQLHRVERGIPGNIRPDGEDGFKIPDSAPVGKNHITFFASESKFPAGETWKARGFADRVVHPFYTMDKPVVGFDPKKMIKRTIEIEIRK